jgi:protein-tyrosine phosphatase
MTVTDIDIDILPNLRDLGGLPSTDGRMTRTGVLYRSALPAPGDIRPTAVDHWPARTVVDLRSPREFATRAHPLQSDDTAVHQISLLSDADVGAPNQGARLTDIYQGILTNAGERLAEVLQVAATAPGPVLLHCAAGKDRTGIAVALLLRTAGVAPDDIVADYVTTNEHMPAVLARITRFAPELGQTHPNGRDLRGVVPEALECVLARWDAHPGGVHAWVRSHGATDETLELWTARFTASE